MMYDELIKNLRDCSEMRSLSLYKRGLMKQAADAIEALSATISKMEKATHWIPVTERLPEEYVNVLCHLMSLGRQSEYYSIDHLMEDGQWWKAANSWKHEVTHWMPLPAPPKEETE